MPYITTRKNLKLQLSPGLVASYDIQPGNGVGLLWDTKHTYILTYLLSPDSHGEAWTYATTSALTKQTRSSPWALMLRWHLAKKFLGRGLIYHGKMFPESVQGIFWGKKGFWKSKF